ncbi:hypothetical protein APASM_6120 [Actinosynnema pretiosum subsp. pretiosum]|nr:hypothetical protein APASM_6120 [Actinosynnema pretiosum subsp. pretiosum]
MAGRTRTADVVLLAERDGVPLLLAVRRAKPPFRAALALPGGFLEPGEHPLDAAVRELAEETGIRLPRTALRELGDYAAPVATRAAR